MFKKIQINMWDKLNSSNKLELVNLVESHLESDDPIVAKINKKLISDNN
jgi:hypothetical protein